MKALRWIGRHGAELLTALWILTTAIAIAAPLLAEASPAMSAGCYISLAPLCHQHADRSFHLEGHKMALCARCLGIFAGMSVFGVIAIIVRRRFVIGFRAMLLLLAPMVADAFGNIFGLWNTGNTLRAATGALAGFAVVFWIYPIIFEFEPSNENSTN